METPNNFCPSVRYKKKLALLKKCTPFIDFSYAAPGFDGQQVKYDDVYVKFK